MRAPTFREAFELLCIHAASEGRERMLFGDSLERVRSVVPPFLIGRTFPGLYFEFPLTGSPCLDVNILYGDFLKGARIKSDAAGDCERMLDCYTEIHSRYPGTGFGFEIDTSRNEPGQAAIHFQPGMNPELALTFCESIGEDSKGRLYIETAKRMQSGWPVSYFGLFRGREDAPLRVCGYLRKEEKDPYTGNPEQIATVFDAVGFTARDDMMLDRIVELLRLTPGGIDFQFDINPDGSPGDMFAIDLALHETTKQSVEASFSDGPASALIRRLREWGIADERTDLIPETALSTAFPLVDEDGSAAFYALAFLPRWIKVRWKNRKLMPSKCYCLLKGGLLGTWQDTDKNTKG